MNSEYKTLDKALSSIFTGISKVLIKSIIDDLKITNTVSKKSLEEIYNYLMNTLDVKRKKTLKKFEENYTITLNNSLNREDEHQVNFELMNFYNLRYENELFTTWIEIIY